MIYRTDGSHAIGVCRTHLNDPEACSLKRILETDLMHAFITMLNKLAFSKKYLLQPYTERLLCSASAILPAMHSSRQDDQKKDAQKRLVLSYSQGRVDPVAFYTKMAQLKRGITADNDDNALDAAMYPAAVEGRDWQQAYAAKDLSTFLSSWQIRKAAFSADAFNRFIDAIRIESRSQVTFCLKCGLALREQIEA